MTDQAELPQDLQDAECPDCGRILATMSAPPYTKLSEEPDMPVKALAEFVVWALEEYVWEGSDIDSGSAQDKARALGLIRSEPYDPEKHGECSEFSRGDEWFVLADSVKAARLSSPPEPDLMREAVKALEPFASNETHDYWTCWDDRRTGGVWLKDFAEAARVHALLTARLSSPAPAQMEATCPNCGSTDVKPRIWNEPLARCQSCGQEFNPHAPAQEEPRVTAAAELWGSLYGMCCQRKTVRSALAALSDDEKYAMDDEAEQIITAALHPQQEAQPAPAQGEVSAEEEDAFISGFLGRMAKADDAARRTAELERKLEDERRHHASQNLEAEAIRNEEASRLIAITRKWAENPAAWSKEEECRQFRQIRYAAEKAFAALRPQQEAHNEAVEACLPCSFCGVSDDVRTFGPYGWYKQWGISHSCKSFYSGTSESIQGFATEADAIAAWNRRAAPEPPPDTQWNDAVEACAQIIEEAMNPLRGTEWEVMKLRKVSERCRALKRASP